MLFDNRFADAVPTVTSTEVGYSILNLCDWREFTYWKSTSVAGQTITVDCGSAKTADAIGVAAHNLLGAKVRVECSSDNFAADTTLAMDNTGIASDGVFFVPFTSQSKRYWRVVFSGLSEQCYVGVLALGDVLTFERPIDGDYTPEIIDQTADVNDSQNGHMLGATLGFAQSRSNIAFQYMTDAWFQNSMQAAWDDHLSKGLPVFFAPSYTEQPTDVFLYHVESSSGFDGIYQAGGLRWFGLDLRGVYAPVMTQLVWSMGGGLLTPRRHHAGAGEQSAGLVFGGESLLESYADDTESFNGIGWSSENSLLTGRYALAGAGSQSAALSFGGQTGAYSAVTEEFDGTNWAAANAMLVARDYVAGNGTQTAALVFGGVDGIGYALNSKETEEYDGVSWSAGGSLSTERSGHSAAGTQTAVLCFSGYIPYASPLTLGVEEYNGTAWSASDSIILGRQFASGVGTATDALLMGGWTGLYRDEVEVYDGVAWASDMSLLTARYGPAAAGTTAAAMCCGGRGASDDYLGSTELLTR